MPHSRLIPTPSLLLVLLLPGVALAQAPPQPAVPVAADPGPQAPAGSPAVMATPMLPAASGSPGPAATPMPTPAQQAVLDRIRFLRDGDQRRFAGCSYRWDRWKLLADGNRTTTYSCEGTPIVDRTIGVNCSKLQINSYDPLPQPGAKGNGTTDSKADSKADGWAWGTWRLPKPGGEEQMVATLCANALPPPAAPAVTSQPASPSASGAPARPASASKR